MNATRADVLGSLAIVLATAAVAFGPRAIERLSAHPSQAECEALLERYVELKERSVTEKVDARSYAAALDDARRLTGPSFTACTTEITLAEAACAKSATHVDEFERCLR